MALKRVEVKYTGSVQGVGFRYTAERLAKAYPITGFVKNLADGSVEVAAEGEESNLQDFLSALRAEMNSRVDKVSLHWFAPTGEFKTFEIRFI